MPGCCWRSLAGTRVRRGGGCCCWRGCPIARGRWHGCWRSSVSQGANLLDVEHIREGFDLHVRETAVQLVLETRGPGHAEIVTRAVREAGYAEPRAVR